jgi:hypothetical protein
MCLHGLLRGWLYFFVYVDDVRTSEETHLWAFSACYGDTFTFLYVYDVRASQETHLCDSTACYEDSFIFYIRRRCSYHRGNICMCLLYLLRGYLYFFCVDDVRTSQESHLWVSTACYER